MFAATLNSLAYPQPWFSFLPAGAAAQWGEYHWKGKDLLPALDLAPARDSVVYSDLICTQSWHLEAGVGSLTQPGLPPVS